MITVQSKNLAETLMFMLNKDTNEFSKEELIDKEETENLFDEEDV